MLASQRRQFKRQEINLATTITMDGTSFVQCLIRDVCAGGLFIALQQYKGIETLSAQQKILVHFSVNLDHDDKDFSLQVKIVHIDPNGFGVAFEGDSEFFFNALAKEAQTNIVSPNFDKQDSLNSLSKQKRLERDFTTISKKALPIIIHNFYRNAEEKIQSAANDAENYHARIALLDTFTNLKISKNKLFENYCNFSYQFTLFAPSLIIGQPSITSTKSELSLVEKNDYEDWLNLLPVIRNLEALFEPRLNSIQEKLALILKEDKNEIVNPFSPTKLCENFRACLNSIEENELERNWLYALYGETLTKQLPNIYKKIETIFLEYRVQKETKELPNKKRVNSKAKQAIHHHSDLLNSSASENPNSQNAQDPGSAQQTLKKVNEHSHQNPPSLEKVNNTPISSTKTSTKVLNIASNLMHLVQGKSIFQKSPKIKDELDEYSAKEICSALSFLQQSTIESKLQQKDIQNKLQDKLRQTLNHFSAVKKRLSNTDKNNLDVYDSLIKTLLNDNLLSQEVQVYLQQIYIPIMTQVIQNPNLLESGNHPVRDIINHLSKLEMFVKDNKVVKNIHIKELLDQLIKKISNESINNPAIFNSVENDLNELTQSVEKSIELNVKRVQDICEGKQKLRDAKEFVQNEINQNLAGKKIPKIIVTLLETGWQHLLVIAKLNKNNRSYQTNLLTINNLIDWLIGSKQISRKLAMTTLEFIDNELQTVNVNGLLHSNIQNELSDLLLGKKIKLGSKAMEMTSLKIDEKQNRSKSIKKRNKEVDHLRVGEWLTFLLEKDFEPLKIAWINHCHDLFVFVNRDGIKKIELEADDLAEMIREGKANLTDSLDTPVMDRATYMMLQKLHEKLMFNATHDTTTRFLNQKEFIAQLKRKLSKLDNAKYLLCNIEIQDFRTITNACGISGVEALLEQLANLLKQHVNKEDLYARINDRTFSVLLKNCSAEIAKELHVKFIRSEFKWQDKGFAVAASMGIVPLFSENNYEINSILQNVDSANLSALSAGRNCIRVYKDDDESLKSQFNAREWVGRINQVLAENRLFLRCQKIAAINPKADSHSHYEILLGIKGENGKIIKPNDFIPAVERCQRMSEIDQWVVLSVFDWIKNNQNAFEKLGGFSINLSGESINSEEFLEFLEQTLSTCNVPLEKIIFEITETVAADNFQFIQTFIKQIKRFKCKFSLDDFGSGYSSFSYLKKLKVDYLKIDGIFVKDIVNSSTDSAIVSSMNEIAHFLNLKTTAEYVENNEIHALLQKIGVDYVQGWGVEKPKLLSDLV